jgi:hypothetical protein
VILANISDADRTSLDRHVTEIHRLRKRVGDDIIEIGRRLVECKKLVGRGNWLSWLDQQFGWDERTAQRFMSVHEFAGKSDNLSDLSIGVSALYVLAAQSTPHTACDEIVRRNRAGERLTIAGIRRIVQKHKSPRSKHVDIPLRSVTALDLAEMWERTSLAERTRFINNIGLNALFVAMPEDWLPLIERRLSNRSATALTPATELVLNSTEYPAMPSFLQRAAPFLPAAEEPRNVHAGAMIADPDVIQEAQS